MQSVIDTGEGVFERKNRSGTMAELLKPMLTITDAAL